MKRKIKTYVEKYGIDRVSRNLKFHKRYFKTYTDYANGGVECFDSKLFLQDISMSNFPIVKEKSNGWKLDKAPTAEEFMVIYNYLSIDDH